jgi:hypothetical protein
LPGEASDNAHDAHSNAHGVSVFNAYIGLCMVVLPRILVQSAAHVQRRGMQGLRLQRPTDAHGDAHGDSHYNATNDKADGGAHGDTNEGANAGANAGALEHLAAWGNVCVGMGYAAVSTTAPAEYFCCYVPTECDRQWPRFLPVHRGIWWDLRDVRDMRQSSYDRRWI